MKIRENFGELTENCQVKRLKMEYQFTWVLKNFRNLYCSPGHYDESPLFSMGKNNEYEWKLQIYLDGYGYINSNYSNNNDIGVRPFLTNKASHANVKFIIELALLDKDGQKLNIKRSIFTSENINEECFKYFTDRSSLTKNPNLLPEGELRISSQFSFDASSTAEETTEIQYCQYYQKSQLDNFEQLYGSEDFSDFKLIIGKHQFPVHQVILAARSSVFKAMFLSNMRESKEKQVEIKDVDPEIMTKVLQYIYSGKVSKIQDVADQVLPVAEKYQLDALKHICEDILIEQLNVDNIYKMLEFSDNYGAKNLKRKAIDYFKKNFEKLAAADDFKATIFSLPANLQTDIICAPAKTT